VATTDGYAASGEGRVEMPKPESSAAWPERVPRWVDLALYTAQMVIGLALVVLSIGAKYLAVSIIQGCCGFVILYAAIRYGWFARRFHDGI